MINWITIKFKKKTFFEKINNNEEDIVAYLNQLNPIKSMNIKNAQIDYLYKRLS